MRKNGELLGWEDQRMDEVGEVPVKMCQFSLLTDKLSLTLLRWALRGLGLASWHLAGTASGKETLPVVALKQQQLLVGRASMEPTLWLLHRAQFATDSHWSDLPATSSSTQLNPAACPSYKLDTRLVLQPGPRRTLIWEQHAILPPRWEGGAKSHMVPPPATSETPCFVERETANKFFLEPNRSVIQTTPKTVESTPTGRINLNCFSMGGKQRWRE